MARGKGGSKVPNVKLRPARKIKRTETDAHGERPLSMSHEDRGAHSSLVAGQSPSEYDDEEAQDVAHCGDSSKPFQGLYICTSGLESELKVLSLLSDLLIVSFATSVNFASKQRASARRATLDF